MLASIAFVIGPGKISLIATSILLKDALQLHSHTHKVAVDGQVCFSRWWISKCQSQPVTWDCSLASLLSSSVVYIGIYRIYRPPRRVYSLGMDKCTHTHALIHTHTYIHTCTHTYTYTHTHTHTHTCTHTYTYKYICSLTSPHKSNYKKPDMCCLLLPCSMILV